MSLPGFGIGMINDDFHNSRHPTGCDREVEEGCDVFNRPRSEMQESEMFQVEDAELIGAKGLTISTALDCFHY